MAWIYLRTLLPLEHLAVLTKNKTATDEDDIDDINVDDFDDVDDEDDNDDFSGVPSIVSN